MLPCQPKGLPVAGKFQQPNAWNTLNPSSQHSPKGQSKSQGGSWCPSPAAGGTDSLRMGRSWEQEGLEMWLLECHLHQLKTFLPCRSQSRSLLARRWAAAGSAPGEATLSLPGALTLLFLPAPGQCQGHREGVQTQKTPQATEHCNKKSVKKATTTL